MRDYFVKELATIKNYFSMVIANYFIIVSSRSLTKIDKVLAFC